MIEFLSLSGALVNMYILVWFEALPGGGGGLSGAYPQPPRYLEQSWDGVRALCSQFLVCSQVKDQNFLLPPEALKMLLMITMRKALKIQGKVAGRADTRKCNSPPRRHYSDQLSSCHPSSIQLLTFS